MTLRYAKKSDLKLLSTFENHIHIEELKLSIQRRQVIVAFLGTDLQAWLRYGLFWDSIPFLNMLFVLPQYRQQQLGSKLLHFWEEEMRRANYHLLLTSSQSDETAQHFYRKNAYRDAGCLLLKSQAPELFFTKEL